MLKDMLYESLKGLTKILFVSNEVETFIETNNTKPSRFKNMLSRFTNGLDNMLTNLCLISLTGGLYGIWLIIKRRKNKKRA